MTSNPRALALHILNTLDRDHHTLDRVADEALAGADLPEKRDRALVTTLVYGVLRWRNTLDYAIGHFSKTPIHRIDTAVLNILRLGLFQLRFLDRIPDFAAVSGSVDLVRQTGVARLAGFVNGVLRNAARQPDRPVLPDMAKDPVRALCVAKSFPEWMIKRWIDRFGLEETLRLCDVMNMVPPITVRVNGLQATVEQAAASISREAVQVTPGRHAPEALSFFSPRVPVHEMEAFGAGWFQVQDEAAQLIGIFTGPRPGEQVLDACAGLGGKTGHLARLMENQGRVVAADRDGPKLERLGREMERLGVSIVTPMTLDLLAPPDVKAAGVFDRILADCPCSGTGVIRRNPDTRWRLLEKDLSRLQHDQVAMLVNLAGCLRPGGVLVYAVCSMEPEENEAVARGFLNIRRDFDIEKGTAGLLPALAACVDAEGFFRTRPWPHGMDGFFGVRLKKRDA
ncbi:MAG: 16S rRNA (cytosine(967)-C(5))-methyltransferase RsmB [Thermodesulfobacteriota bacterium]